MKPKPQPTSTIVCPNCKREHGLFWKVHGPNKRTLVYRCDKVEYQQNKNTPDEQMRPGSRVVPVGDEIVPAEGLPEELSRKWKAILAEKNQPRMAL